MRSKARRKAARAVKRDTYRQHWKDINSAEARQERHDAKERKWKGRKPKGPGVWLPQESEPTALGFSPTVEDATIYMGDE